jgi:hypothetical protein
MPATIDPADNGPATNLFTNGSFEVPALPTQFVNYTVGSLGLPGWTIVGPAGQALSQVRSDFSGNPPFQFPAQDGNQWIDLTGFNNNAPVGLAQTVPTAPGQVYTIGFWVGNVSGGPFGTTSTVNVELSQGGGGSCTNAAPGLVLTWQHCTVNFTAAGPTTTVTFRNADPAFDNSNGLDNVSIDLARTRVPEPASWAMLLAGFALAGGVIRRKTARRAIARA